MIKNYSKIDSIESSKNKDLSIAVKKYLEDQKLLRIPVSSSSIQ